MHSCPEQPSGLRASRPRPHAATSCQPVSRCLHRKAARGRIPALPAPEGALAGHERMFLIEGFARVFALNVASGGNFSRLRSVFTTA
ncbi:hypothetical protein Bxe_B0436 [Paraburkholderia xenovorans LB400]|uniref:Uncharacterized protein n=1 Tax=Paraburkholderia xenovorans (strain LB400) TaxID=266265 RepID=Q13K78_PARXL|nr:hypothetical protein Bxe_B0436 [Paraburkholderia xenovorans LB400]